MVLVGRAATARTRMTSANEEAGEESSEPPTDEDSHDVEGMEEMAQGDEAIGETTAATRSRTR